MTALKTIHGDSVRLDDALDALSGSFQGPLITPDDSAYGDARALWNGMADRAPALIARCEDVEDVRRAVHFAAAHKILVAVRGGGHNVAGTAGVDGGLVVDLSAMSQVEVDPVRRRARAGGGAMWADLDAATQAHGLAAPAAWSRTPGSAASRWAGGSAGSDGNTGSAATTWWGPKW